MQDEQTSNKFIFNSSTIHSINPLGMRVLVRIMDSAAVSKGGLYLPENAVDSMSESIIAKVVAVASAKDAEDGNETNVSGVPLDTFVLIEKKSGIKVPWDDHLRVVETADVLAIVDCIEMS